MGLLFALLGAIAGMAVGMGEGVEGILLSILFLILTSALAIRKGKGKCFLFGFLPTLCFALCHLFLPIAYGEREIAGMVVKTGENYALVSNYLRCYYVPLRSHPYQIGDFLLVRGRVGEIRMTTYESQFSFPSYLRGLGCVGEVSSPTVKGIILLPLRLGERREGFLSSFNAPTKALLDAILFGRKDYSASIQAKASRIGLLFLLSSSGLFFGMLLRGIEQLLSLRLKERKASLITLLIGLAILPLNAEKLGLWRVLGMRSAKIIDRKGKLDYPSRLGIVGLLLITLFPFNALSSSLWIGGGISLGRYYFSSFLNDRRRLIAFLKGYGFVQLFMLPLSLGNGEFHPLSPFYGPPLLPLVGLFALLGLGSFLTLPATSLLEGYASFLERILSMLEKLDLALPLPALAKTSVFLLYLALALGMLLREIGAIRVRNALVVGILAIYCLSLVPFGYLGVESVGFVNVGQGDCTLVYRRGCAVMIDTGGVAGMDLAGETLVPYLRKKRIYHLDAVILTHADFDHSGALEGLRSRFEVRRVLTETSDFPFRMGGLEFANHNVYGGEGENDRSLVLDFKVAGKRVIVAGDAPMAIERKILSEGKDLDCDILKVGHHGSDTSTSEEWLDALRPEIALISCGRKNSYGHPSKKVLKRLQERSITIRRTDLEGSVEYSRFLP